ncbi:MAG TPA: hypothetical protein VK465_06460 [Fibrobacteria bacterium]|nr:hypothetical protein [Fibrobacteria bacterium]
MDRLNQLMEEFRAFVINTETPVPLPCWIPIATFSAVTAISMEQDTAKAKVFFASILKMDPRLEIFDLGVSYPIQSIFDEVKSEMRFRLGPEEWFVRRLVPPPLFDADVSERTYGMRCKYHDLRSIYALAIDSVSYLTIGRSLKGETDPAFQLFASDLLLRAGTSLATAKRLVGQSQGRRSEIIAGRDLRDWAKRLSVRIGSMEMPTPVLGSKHMQTTFGDRPEGKKRPKLRRLALTETVE